MTKTIFTRRRLPSQQLEISDLDVISLGFPILPKMRNTLFPDNYLINNNRVLEKRKDDLTLRGSVLELHYQTVEEFNCLDRQDRKEIRAYVDDLKERGYRFMIHHPFLHQRGEGHLNMDFAWLTIPEKFKSGKVFVTEIPYFKQKNYAREVPLETTQEFLRYCDFLGVRNITFHATKPGEFLVGKDYQEYDDKIGELGGFIKKEGLDVAIAVETGGITIEQLVDLHQKHSVNVNLDTAHLFLDLDLLHPELSYFHINQKVADFFREHRDFIPQLHLTQTSGGDAHDPISERGMLTWCNEEILRLMQDDFEEGKTFLAMVEATRTDRDRAYVKKVVKEDRENIHYSGQGEAVVNIFMGYPVSGKSQAAKTLEEVIGPIVCSDEERIFHNRALSQDKVIPVSAKDRVYQELYDRLAWRVRRGHQSNVEASFRLRSRRDSLYQLLTENQAKDIYLWNFTRSEEDCQKRLDARVDSEEKFPPTVLVSHEIYQQFMYPSNGEEKPSHFNTQEVPEELRTNVHVVNYDTSRQEILVTNPDTRTKECVTKLVEYALREGYGSPRVSEVSW